MVPLALQLMDNPLGAAIRQRLARSGIHELEPDAATSEDWRACTYPSLPWCQIPVASMVQSSPGDIVRYDFLRAFDWDFRPNGLFIRHDGYYTPVWLPEDEALAFFERPKPPLVTTFRTQRAAPPCPLHDGPSLIQGADDIGALRQQLVQRLEALGLRAVFADWPARLSLIRHMAPAEAFVALELCFHCENQLAKIYAPYVRSYRIFLDSGGREVLRSVFAGTPLQQVVDWIVNTALPGLLKYGLHVHKTRDAAFFEEIKAESGADIEALRTELQLDDILD